MSLLAISAMSFPEMSPAILQIDLGFLGLGKFPIRWYALAYILGLLIGWRYALALAQRPNLWGGVSPADKDDIDDLLFYATLGVIFGGRIGYILFYQLPYQWDQTMSDPASLLRIWEGGMSFHGGLIGEGDLAHDLIAYPPGLRVKHVEGVPLVLHADVEHLGVLVPHQIGRAHV